MKRRKLGILTAAIIASITLLPMSGAAAAEPLAAGAYDFVLDGKALSIAIGEDGTPSVSADDGLIVLLRYDELGRALNIVRIETPDGTYELDVDVADDGSYTQTVSTVADDTASDGDVDEGEGAVDEDGQSQGSTTGDEDLAAQDDDADGEVADEDDQQQLLERHGTIVSTVARCAPRGRSAKVGGWPNHGTIVSSAANRLPLELTLADPATGEPMAVTADLTSLAGAEMFCAFVAEHQAAVTTGDLDDETSDAEKGEKQTQKDEKKDEKSQKKAAKSEQKAEKKAEKSSSKKDKASEKAEKSSSKQAKKAEKAERKSDKKGKKDRGGSEDT